MFKIKEYKKRVSDLDWDNAKHKDYLKDHCIEIERIRTIVSLILNHLDLKVEDCPSKKLVKK